MIKRILKKAIVSTNGGVNTTLITAGIIECCFEVLKERLEELSPGMIMLVLVTCTEHLLAFVSNVLDML